MKKTNKLRLPGQASNHEMIQQTLRQLRENAPGRNPLAGALESYRQRLQELKHSQLSQVRNDLIHRIMQEDDHNTRFVLRLMHDVTDAVCEGRRPAYLLPAKVS